MNNELFFLIKKHTDTTTEQTTTKPQESLEFKMNEQMKTFSFNSSINMAEEEKWKIAATSFEATNFVFKITDDNNSPLISIPGQWRNPNYLEEGIIDKLKSKMNFISQNDIELQVQEVRKVEIK